MDEALTGTDVDRSKLITGESVKHLRQVDGVGRRGLSRSFALPGVTHEGNEEVERAIATDGRRENDGGRGSCHDAGERHAQHCQWGDATATGEVEQMPQD